MTSFMYKIRDFSTPRLFILQFIFNKTKVCTLFCEESYHNTPIYYILKRNYERTLQLTYSAAFKSLYPISTASTFYNKSLYPYCTIC